MKYQGRIQHWDDAKGFGFVEPNGGGTRAFAHIKAFSNRSRRPVNGDIIVYELKKDNKGSYQAHNINLLKDYKTKRITSAKHTAKNKFTIVFLTCFAIALALLTFFNRLPATLIFAYCAISGVTFLLYAIDKSAAEKNRWRISEAKLHFFGFIGGWPGALVAQHVFKHKRSKAEFMRVYWALVLLNLTALGLVAFNIIDIPALPNGALTSLFNR